VPDSGKGRRGWLRLEVAEGRKTRNLARRVGIDLDDIGLRAVPGLSGSGELRALRFRSGRPLLLSSATGLRNGQ